MQVHRKIIQAIKKYWKIFNNSEGYVSEKQTSTYSDHLVRLENIECLICMVTYIKITKVNIKDISVCIETLEGTL